MKKIISLLIFVFITLIGYTQQDTIKVSKYVTNNDTEKLIDKYSEKIESAITTLAQTLKQPAEFVWKTLIKQQIINAWIWLIVIIIASVLITMLWYSWYNDYDKKDWWGLPVLFTVFFIVLLIAGASKVFTGLINPEYGALKEILELL